MGLTGGWAGCSLRTILESQAVSTVIESMEVLSQERIPPCPFCGESSVRPVIRLAQGSLWRCKACGCMRRHPVPSPKEAERYYRQTYGRIFLTQTETPARKAMFRSLLQNLGSAQGRRLLDIGAGSGLFVRMAREAGWRADGTELSEIYRTWAKDHHHLTLSDPMIEPPPKASYDLATLINVLDQAPDPLELLRTVRRSLRSGGRLLVRVPNGSFHVRSARLASLFGLKKIVRMAVLHPYAFDPQSLRYVVSKEFRILKLRNAKLAGPSHSSRFLAVILRGASQLLNAIAWLASPFLLWAPSIEMEAEVPANGSHACPQ